MTAQKISYNFLLALFSPLLAFFLSWRTKDYAYLRGSIIIFITIYGFTINVNEGSDASRHVGRVFENYTHGNLGLWLSQLWDILRFSPQRETNDDVYIHFLSFLVGSVFGIPQYFYVFVSFVYAYFFSGTIIRLLKLSKRNEKWILVIPFTVLLLIWVHIDGIGTVRTWTGMWVLVYAAFSYLDTKKVKYLFLLFVPPFIHIGYFAMAIPTWIILLFPIRPLFVFIFYCSSFVISLDSLAIIERLSKTNELAESKAGSYYRDPEDEERAARQQEYLADKTWYKQLQKGGIQRYAVHTLIILFFITRVSSNYFSNLEKKLFLIGVGTIGFAEYMSFLFAVHNRSYTIGSVFVSLAILIFIRRGGLQTLGKKIQSIHKIGYLFAFGLLMPFLVYKLSKLFYTLSIFMVSLPILTQFGDDLNVSIREFLGWIIGK